MSEMVTAKEYKDLIVKLADETIYDLSKEAEEEEVSDEVMELMERTAGLYEDAGARMEAAMEVLAEVSDIIGATEGEDLDKLADELDDETLAVVGQAYQYYDTAMEVLAEAEEDAEACEAIFDAAGLYDEDEEHEEDEE